MCTHAHMHMHAQIQLYISMYHLVSIPAPQCIDVSGACRSSSSAALAYSGRIASEQHEHSSVCATGEGAMSCARAARSGAAAPRLDAGAEHLLRQLKGGAAPAGVAPNALPVAPLGVIHLLAHGALKRARACHRGRRGAGTSPRSTGAARARTRAATASSARSDASYSRRASGSRT